MNAFMIRRLVAKDWAFLRWPLTGYLVGGLAALSLIAFGGTVAFNVGGVLLLTTIISLGIHLIMLTVVNERNDHTLTFVMSLPIDVRDYTTAKILANVAIYGAAWTALAVGAVAVIAGRAAVPDGLIPFALTVLLEMFAGYAVMLAVALVSESMSWTIGAMVVGNLAVQGVMYWVSNVPAVKADLLHDRIAWPPQVLGVLAAEILVIGLALGLTFFLQSRKTDFL